MATPTIDAPSFEVTQANFEAIWNPTPATGLTAPAISTAQFHDGTQSCAFPAISALSEIIQTGISPLTPNTNYTLTFWLRRGSTLTATVDFNVQITGAVNIIGSLITLNFLTPEVWVERTVTFDTDAGVTAISLGFELPLGLGVGSDTLYIDQLDIVPTASICFAPESKILTRSIGNGFISETRADQTYASNHEVYDINNKIFVPVKYNAITGPTKRLMLLKKDCLGPNQPSEDLRLTSGHKIVVDGVEKKAGKIKQAKKIKVKSTKLYSIVTEKRQPIQVNGLAALTHDEESWLAYAKKRGFVWKDNKSSA